MKITHVIQRYPPSIGGSETWCQGLCRYLAAAGHEVSVMTLDVYKEEEFWKEAPEDDCLLRFGSVEYDGKVKVLRYPRTKINGLFFRLFKKLEKLAEIYLYGPHSFSMYFAFFKEFRGADIIHLHTCPYPHNLVAYFIAKLYQKKVVYVPHFHPSHPAYELRANYGLMKRAEAIYAVSDLEKTYLEGKGIKGRNIHVTYNSLDTEDFKAVDPVGFRKMFYSKYGLNDSTKVVAFIGRKIEYKGPKLLIEVVKELSKEFDVKLFLAGPDFEWFRKYYADLEAEDKANIIDLGIISHDEKVDLLHLSDLLVLPSQYEAFGIVFLEAWICGVPVMGTDYGAIPGLVGDGGCIFKMNNKEDLKEKMRALLRNPLLLKKMAECGKNKVLERYTWDINGDTVLDTYYYLLREKLRKHTKIKKFIKKGWFPVETLGFEQWAWSGKEAIIEFPAGHQGYRLVISGVNKKVIFCDQSKNKILAEYVLGYTNQAITVRPGIRAVKIVTENPCAKGASDKRLLGICLHAVEPVDFFHPTALFMPKILEIELNTTCNMQPPCVMCVEHVSGSIEKTEMPKKTCEKIKTYFKYAAHASFHGNGEPLLYPGLLDLLKESHREKTFTQFNTNGLLLNRHMSECLIKNGLSMINVSIDAATPETYCKIRRANKLEEIKQNIRYLSDLKKKGKIRWPKVLVNMTLMKQNFRELPGFMDLAHEVGADAVYVNLLRRDNIAYKIKEGDFTFDYAAQVITAGFQGLKETLLFSQRKAHEFGIEFLADHKELSDMLNNVSESRNQPDTQPPRCRKPWENALITRRGDVVFCCHMDTQKAVLGNINTEDLASIWNSPKAMHIRRKILNDIMPNECFSCPRHCFPKAEERTR